MNPRNLLAFLLALSVGLNVYLLSLEPSGPADAPIQEAGAPSTEFVAPPDPARAQPTLPDALPQPVDLEPEPEASEIAETPVVETPEIVEAPVQPQEPVVQSGGPLRLVTKNAVKWTKKSAESTQFRLEFQSETTAEALVGRIQVVDALGNPLAVDLFQEPASSVVTGETQHPWDAEKLVLRLELEDEVFSNEFEPSEEVRFLSARADNYGNQFQIQLSATARIRGQLADYLSILPETRFQSYVNYRGAIVLTGAFQPDTVYQIQVKPGLQGQNGFRVVNTQVLAVKTEAFQPVFRFAASGPYFPKGRDALIPISASNVDSGTITATRIFPNNTLAFHRDGSYTAARNGESLEPFTIEPDLKPNEQRLVFAPMNKILEGAEYGIYRLETSAPGVSRWSADPRTLVLTDIGLEATVTRDRAEVWARSLTDGQPLRGVSIEIRSYQDQLLASGVTDGSGGASIALPATERPYLVLAERGSDLSFLDLNGRAQENLAPLGFAASRDTSLVYEGYLFTERGVYRPGEGVELAGLVKDRAMEVAAGLPGELEIRDPQGALFDSRAVTTSAYGYFETHIELPEYAKTGLYTATLRQPGDTSQTWGSTNFRVNFFTPARMRVDLTPSAAEGLGGETIELQTQADYYFGLPASEMPVLFELQPRAVSFRADGYESYTFEDPERTLSGAPRPQIEATTDANGAASASFVLPKNVQAPSAVRYQIAASVIEPSGRTISANSSVLLHPHPRYVGARAEGPYQIEDPEWSFDWVSVDPSGALVANKSLLRYRLEREEWNYVMTEDGNGNRVWEWTKQVHVEAQGELPSTLNSSEGSFSVKPPQVESRYRLVLESQEDGARASVRFDAGRGASTPALAQLQSLRLTPDQSRYLPGATATLRFDAPAAGEALVSVSDQRGIQSSTHSVKRGENAIQIRLPRTPFGSAYASVTLMKSDFKDRRIPRRLFGVAHLPVSQIERAIAVNLEAPEAVRPGATFQVTLEMTQAGAARAGQVKLMAVDEGVLALTQFATPDPHRFFFGARGPSFSNHSLYDALFPEFESAAGGSSSVAGDEVSAWSVNPNQAKQKETAIVLHPVIDVPESGTVSVEVTAPEHNGELRLMAVAFNESAVGSDDRPLTLRDTLALELDGPKAVAPGDSFDLTASLWNQDLPAGPAEIRIQINGAAQLLGAPTASQELETGERWTPRFRVQTAPDWTGVLRAQITATLGGETRETWVEIGVRPVSPRERRAEWIEIPAGESREIVIDNPWIDGSGRFRLDAGVTPLIEVGPVREWLESYPYGCLEQTTSGAMPSLFLTTLVPNLNADERPNAQLVENAILRLRSLLRPGGRFTMWPGSQDVWMEGSLYAAHFLAEARAQGFQSASGLLDSMSGYLQGLAMDRDDDSPSIESRAYALYILAKMGRPENELARALSGATRTPRFARVLLAGALALGDDRRAAASAFANAVSTPEPEFLDRRPLRNDPVRRAAFTLAIAATIDPTSPETNTYLERLRALRQPSGHWGHTQANAMAAFGYGTLARFRDVDARTKGTLSTADGTEWPIEGASPLGLRGAEWLGKTITVTSDGPGPLYLSLSSSGFPTAPVVEPQVVAEGIAISKTYLNRDGARQETWNQGDLVTVELNVRADTRIEDVVIADLLPGFLQVEDTALATSVATAESLDDAPLNFYERRDDRLLLYLDLWEGEDRTFRYTGRVVTPGTYRIPGVSAEAMYRPDVFASMDAAQEHNAL